jgi:flagellar protein FlaG
MEPGNITKPPAIAFTTPARADTLQSAAAVATELAPEAAVQQASKVEPVRFEQSSELQSRAALDAVVRDMIKRRLEIDPKTKEVIFQVVNKETGEVLRQIPDEAMLKLRAYAKEMRERDAASDERRPTTRTA